MCGIAGAVSLTRRPIADLPRTLGVMGELIAHRGPDGHGVFSAPGEACGLAHRRLAIIDLSPGGAQPMSGPRGATITFNGEIYNYRELMDELGSAWTFRSRSDTETILAAYARWGANCPSHLRGMFAFAIWDGDRLFAARDRFGIKPFYYARVGDTLYFASEIKALLPVLPEIETDPEALAEYLTFQYTIGDRSLFRRVQILPPGHALLVEGGEVRVSRYWDVRYEIDFDHSRPWFDRRLRELTAESIGMHLRSDVPVGAYLSGGIDSSLIASLASQEEAWGGEAFHGKFTDHPGYDESGYAEMAARHSSLALRQMEIGAADFRDRIEDVIYHLDHPVAGPGSFPQLMVSGLAAERVKVVLGGQGGDEIFGGYARYLIAYFEQAMKAAIDGTYRNGDFVVTPESIIPQMTVLQEYRPLIRRQFAEGLFGPLDERYFRLIDRSADMHGEVDWAGLDREGVRERFRAIFNSERNVRPVAYFDAMTHFDFKCLLPALLHVEDRMSMAHGLEARVPFLDHPLVEFAATVPPIMKFKGGQMKYFLKEAFRDAVPAAIMDRRDKMGFPVPLKEWFEGPLSNWVGDLFSSRAARERPFLNAPAILANLQSAERFSRKTWGLLSLELWHRRFHDRAAEYRRLLQPAASETPPPRRLAAAR